MHMAFLSRVFKNLQWYGMTKPAALLEVLPVLPFSTKIAAEGRLFISTSVSIN